MPAAYGVSTEQTKETIDLSSGADAPAGIQKIIDAAADEGVTLTGLLTSRKNITKLRSNEAIQKAINGTSGVGALVRTNALYAYLEDEFGISRIITNDLTYGADATIGEDGRPTVTQKRYFPQNKLSFFAANSSGRLGDGLWGDPPEADIKDYFPVSTSNVTALARRSRRTC